MNLLDALFAGAKAFLTEVSAVGRTVVREVLKEIDQSAFGRAATRLVDGVVDRYFKQARGARISFPLQRNARSEARRRRIEFQCRDPYRKTMPFLRRHNAYTTRRDRERHRLTKIFLAVHATELSILPNYKA